MKEYKLTFSGDIMLPNTIIDVYKTTENKYNFNSIFDEIKEYLKKSDYIVGNLETPITNNYEEIKYKPFSYTSPIEFARAVKEAGFNFVTTANNHCLDNKIEGIKKTIDSLEKIGLKHTGIFCNNKFENFSIIELGNIKIALLSYTYGTNAYINNLYLDNNNSIKVNLLQEQELSNNRFIRFLYQSKSFFIKAIRKSLGILKIFQLNKPAYERNEKSKIQREDLKETIEKAKEKGADYIIMCMHEGGQYNQYPIKRAIKNAQFIQDCGVDLIIGNHEHRIQKFIYRKNKLITYCLGNFLGAAGVISEPFHNMSEYSILLNVYLRKNESNIEVEKNTFTITKTVINKQKGENAIKIKLLYDIIQECNDQEEKKKLMYDNQRIVKIFANKNIEVEDIKKEYLI